MVSTKNNTSTLEQIENDLKSFYDFCKENHLTNEEIAKICVPLTSSIKKSKLIQYLRYLIIFLLTTTILYLLTYSETISWNVSAISRIALIKLLPFYDWRHLKNEKCLLNNYFTPKQSPPPIFDCVLCEAFDKIYVEPQIDPTFLNTHYLDLHKPVIIPNALDNWPIYHNPSVSLIEAHSIQDSIPCKLSTNIYNGVGNLGRILKKLDEFDEYFLHFQNCEFDATKSFRIVAPRLDFIPVEVSPVQYNWVMMSRNYNVSAYKMIELKEPITVIGQAIGSNVFKLVPRRNCNEECPIINIELMRGEALVFTSLWDLEYKPSPVGENIAVILEMH